MATDGDGGNTSISPDDAFAVLGNETRMELLQTLGDADGALTFSELRDRAEVRDSGRFNYHLDRLEGHFIAKTDRKYELRQAGRRVIEAVLSGTVTEAPVVDRTEVDMHCPYCDAPIEVRFIEERVEAYCTTCAGTFEYSGRRSDESVNEGFLGMAQLPPAGIQGRTPLEILEAGGTWGNIEFMAGASGICPRCSAPIDTAVTVCEEHDATDGLCDRCDSHHQVRVEWSCTNCIHSTAGVFSIQLRTDPDLLSFQLDHGLNPINPAHVSKFVKVLLDYDEEIVSTDPFKAQFTFTLDEEALSLTVDEDLTVVDATRYDISETS